MASRKFLCEYKNNPEIKAYIEAENENIKSFFERKKFLEKQSQALADDIKKNKDRFWSELIAKLVAAGKLEPGFDHNAQYCELEEKDCVIYTHDHCGHDGIQDFIAGIFGGKPPFGGA